ncbi:MAG: hypothetical protein ACFFC3_03260 [Candidatus Odinarchaeota archaeon]
MPVGLFLVVHDDIRGPKIKCSYFKNPVELPQDFISKLYMSHAGFESSSSIEIKFDRYRSVSSFTGSLDRRTQKEGILGILFEENEDFKNLDLFLQRNLTYTIDNPDNNTMEDIFSNKLLNYLKLIKIFHKVEIEWIPEIFIIQGDKKFKSFSLKISEKQVSNIEMSELFDKIMKKEEISPYQYLLLKSDNKNFTYLLLKFDRINPDIEKIVSILEPYLKRFYDYSVELLILFFLASEVKLVPLNPKLFNIYSDKKKSVLKLLQSSSEYTEKFNEIISLMINGDIYLSPLL